MRLAGAVVLGVALLVLLWAWIDGGEEELRPIEQPVELPEDWR